MFEMLRPKIVCPKSIFSEIFGFKRVIAFLKICNYALPECQEVLACVETVKRIESFPLDLQSPTVSLSQFLEALSHAVDKQLNDMKTLDDTRCHTEATMSNGDV